MILVTTVSRELESVRIDTITLRGAIIFTTVNSEIFAIILFSRKALNHIFAMLKFVARA